MLQLLTIGHSYVVAQNRRLAHEMAVAGAGKWQVTAVAPRSFPGDLRPVHLEPAPGEACALEPLDVWLASSPHLFVYRGLRAVLNRPWDVVHCWEEPYVAAGTQVASLIPAGARFVPATFQNLRKHYPPPLRLFECRVMTRAAAWIAFGECVRDTQHDRPLYAARPFRVIPPGVDLQRFRPDAAARAATRAQLGWNGDVPVIGFVGRFVQEKGLGVLTRALPRVGGCWRALFVGGGPMLRDLEQFAAVHPGRVQILTAVDHDRIPAFVNAMDVLCVPSQTTNRWREQFGRVLIEAMACGTPVIASRSGEIPHVVDEAGVLVNENDDGAWVAAIDGLLANSTRRAELSQRGLARARARYGWPAAARAHLSFFDELLTQ